MVTIALPGELALPLYTMQTPISLALGYVHHIQSVITPSSYTYAPLNESDYVIRLQIIITFIASSGLAVSLSILHIFLTPSLDAGDNVFDYWFRKFLILCIKGYAAAVGFKRGQILRKPTERRRIAVRVIERMILSLSDQLLLTGLAVLIAGFWIHCSISVYHFTLVSDLAWFASSVHLTTLDTLDKYLRDRPILRNWRVFLMICMAVFLIASTILQGHAAWYISWPYDAQCVFDDFGPTTIGGSPAVQMYVNLLLIGVGYASSIPTLFLEPPVFCRRWLHTKPQKGMKKAIERAKHRILLNNTGPSLTIKAKKAFSLASITCVRAFGALHSFVYSLVATLFFSRWLGLGFDIYFFYVGLDSLLYDRTIPKSDMDGDENVMSFGQIIPILLLSSTVFVGREAYEGEC